MAVERFGGKMVEGESIEFLESTGSGILSFGDADGGYGIPMAFGYDSAADRCVFQFAFGEESTKAAFVEEGARVTLSVYEWHSIDDWRSVVVHGTLHRVPDEEGAEVAGVFAEYANITSLDVFSDDLEDLDFEWYVLRIDRKQGRRSVD